MAPQERPFAVLDKGMKGERDALGTLMMRAEPNAGKMRFCAPPNFDLNCCLIVWL